jgi:hypothetical protein
LYGFTQICVTISHTNILFGFLCDFREKHTNIQQIAQIYYEWRTNFCVIWAHTRLVWFLPHKITTEYLE